MEPTAAASGSATDALTGREVAGGGSAKVPSGNASNKGALVRYPKGE